MNPLSPESTRSLPRPLSTPRCGARSLGGPLFLDLIAISLGEIATGNQDTDAPDAEKTLVPLTQTRKDNKTTGGRRGRGRGRIAPFVVAAVAFDARESKEITESLRRDGNQLA